MDESSAFVSGALALVLQVSRVAGVAPLRFVKQRGGWRISVSTCFSVYGCLLVASTNLVTIATMVGELLNKTIRMQTPIRRIVWLIDASLMMTLAFLGAATAPSGMRSMINCLNHLQKINNELNITPWQRRSEMKKSILIVLFCLITVALTIVDHRLLATIIYQQYGDYGLRNVTLNELPDAITVTNNNLLYIAICIMYMFYYGCFWITQLQIFQFMLITLHIRQSFKALNDKLRNISQGAAMTYPKKILLKSPMDKRMLNKKRKSVNSVIDNLAFVGKVKPVDDLKTRPAHEKVRRLALTYVSICDVVREVDHQHGLVLLLLLSSILLHLIITPYYLFNNIISKTINDNTQHIVVQIMWFMLHGTNIFMVIEPCHLTIEEIQVTQEQISHLTRYTSSLYEPLSAELDLFFRHILLNQVSFSPLKVATLTRGLVPTLLAGIATYLVIIIQM